MKKFHWFLCALQLSSALSVSPEKGREEMARYGNSDGGNELHPNRVLPDPKNGGVNEGGLQSMPLTEASSSIQMGKRNSWLPGLSVTEYRRWLTSLNPSSETRSTNRRRLPLSSSYPSQSLHFSSFQNPSLSPNPSPYLNPSPSSSYSALPYPYRISYPSLSSSYSALPYPYKISYPSSSSAQALHNLVSLSPSPYRNDPIMNISPHPQPPLPSANWVPTKMQAAAVVTKDNRVDGNKSLLAKFRTVITVTSSPLNQVDYVTKTYLMVFDEHGAMHMNSTAGTAYWDNIKQKIK